MEVAAFYRFNPYAIPPLIIAACIAVVGLWVLLRDQLSAVSRVFAVACSTVFIWQITKVLMYLAADPNVAYVWARLGYLGVAFIGPSLFHLCTLLLGTAGRQRTKVRLAWAVGAVLCAVMVGTDWIVTGVWEHFWGFYPRWSAYGLIFLAYFGTMMALVALEFWRQYRQAGAGVYRKRVRGLMLAFAIVNTGSLDYLGTYGISFYPTGYLTVFFFLIVLAHAITRYRLIDLTPSFAAGKILSTMADPLLVIDGESRIRIVNDAVQRVLGYERAELIDRPLARLAGSDAEAAERLRRIAAAPGERDQETTLYTRSGEPVGVSVSTSLIDDVEGATVGTVLIARDIRERLAAARAVRESEERFRALIENISDVIVVLNPDGKARFISASVRRVLGYDPDEWVGRSGFDVVHPDDAALAQSQFAALAEAGAPSTGECRVRHADGSWRTVEATATNLLHDPAVRGIIVVYQDVTDRKAAEEALRESEEALRHSQRMEAVGRLAGGVAHDFNNLLTVINGETLLLLESPHLDAPTRGALDEVLRAGNRAGDLTRQLLAFSRRLVLQPKLLDLNVVVTDLEKMLRRLIGEDVKLAVALEPNLGKVKADPGQIEQVLLNLVVNARDAMPRGGTLNIETRNFAGQVDGAPADATGFVSLSVRDSGEGMDEATQQRVFEPFFTTKEQGKGTGLGLSTVYGIVHQSGGTVQLESRVGEGSVFRVLLPRAEEEALVGSVPTGTVATSGGTETVLLVEDEGSVRALTRTILTRCGYTVLEARNGVHALRLCDESTGPVDLLITDVVMPEMGGQQLAETISRRYPDVRVLYMSGYTDDAIVRHGVETGVDFLAKPFTPAALAQKVRQVLDAPSRELPSPDAGEATVA